MVGECVHRTDDRVGDDVLNVRVPAEVKDALRKNTDLALSRGVFGVPTLFVGERSFWGNDRLHFAEQELSRSR